MHDFELHQEASTCPSTFYSLDFLFLLLLLFLLLVLSIVSVKYTYSSLLLSRSLAR